MLQLCVGVLQNAMQGDPGQSTGHQQPMHSGSPFDEAGHGQNAGCQAVYSGLHSGCLWAPAPGAGAVDAHHHIFTVVGAQVGLMGVAAGQKGRDRIKILEDTDNDGHFDKRTVFWDLLAASAGELALLFTALTRRFTDLRVTQAPDLEANIFVTAVRSLGMSFTAR